MAEEKKPTKPTGGVSDTKASEQIISLLAGLLFLAIIVSGLVNYINNLQYGTLGTTSVGIVDYFLEHIWPVWKIVAAALSALALGGIIYSSWKLRAINLEEQKIYNPLPDASVPGEAETVEPGNEKWAKVIGYMNSDNASNWRLAIIEADVMLEEALRTAGYEGESVGDMLKSIDKNEFQHIEAAWEAHKVRNAIAHSGGDFQLNERETKRVIALFEKVFKEFGMI